MANVPVDDDGLGEEITKAFATDEGVSEHPAAPAVEDAKREETMAETPADAEEPKKQEETDTPLVDRTEGDNDTQAPETPPASEDQQAKPLTEDSIRRIMSDMRNEERNSSQEMQTTVNDVLDAYYPDGLSNVLVDQATGKQLRTPQDVVDAARATGGDMSMEEAAQWLLNEQYKLDNSIKDIQRQAVQIAETTVNFKRDAVAALQKYEPLFNAYPQLQSKVYKLMMQQVKVDQNKGVILSAPDVMDLYDTYLEPYQQAYEYSTNQPATNPVGDNGTTPPATPGVNDRLDEGGDGGASPVDDPNDFAQQVNKELAKGI